MFHDFLQFTHEKFFEGARSQTIKISYHQGLLANRLRQRDDDGQNKLVQISILNFKNNMSCIIRCMNLLQFKKVKTEVYS